MLRYTLLLLALLSTYSMAATPFESLSDIGQYEVKEEDFVYAIVDGLELRAHSYRPVKTGDVPALVDVHGGAWNLYNRMAGELYNKALASSGVYVLAVDFRQGPDFQHPLGSRDVAAAVRYLKTHAKQLAINANQIGLVGSSSGGHLALLAGLKPNAKQHLGSPIVTSGSNTMDANNIDASVAYIIALWPVSDPVYRYAYAKEVKRDELVQYHNNYFGSDAAMQDASIQRVLKEELNQATKLPAVLVVQPGEDANIPRPMTFALLEALQNAKVDTDYLFYSGMPHAFGHRPSAATDDLIRAMRDYINRQLAKNTSID